MAFQTTDGKAEAVLVDNEALYVFWQNAKKQNQQKKAHAPLPGADFGSADL